MKESAEEILGRELSVRHLVTDETFVMGPGYLYDCYHAARTTKIGTMSIYNGRTTTSPLLYSCQTGDAQAGIHRFDPPLWLPFGAYFSMNGDMESATLRYREIRE